MAYISLNLLFRQRLFLLIALLFFQFNAIAQNLVPNPSFEEHDGCPQLFYELWRANDWFTVNGSPDYFNLCGTINSTKIPETAMGFQNCFNLSDSAFVGIVTGRLSMKREMIASALQTSLTVGDKYYISFNYANGYTTGLECFCNHLGVRFSTFKPREANSSVAVFDNYFIDNNSQFTIDSLNTDTTNWIKFQSSFIADSSYNYITVGNFYDNISLECLCVDSNSTLSYIFLDNICLSKDSLECTMISPSQLYPFIVSVGDGEFFINGGAIGEALEISFYTLLGQEVLNYKGTERRLFLDLPKGIYIIKINNQSIKIINF